MAGKFCWVVERAAVDGSAIAAAQSWSAKKAKAPGNRGLVDLAISLARIADLETDLAVGALAGGLRGFVLVCLAWPPRERRPGLGKSGQSL